MGELLTRDTQQRSNVVSCSEPGPLIFCADWVIGVCKFRQGYILRLPKPGKQSGSEPNNLFLFQLCSDKPGSGRRNLVLRICTRKNTPTTTVTLFYCSVQRKTVETRTLNNLPKTVSPPPAQNFFCFCPGVLLFFWCLVTHGLPMFDLMNMLGVSFSGGAQYGGVLLGFPLTPQHKVPSNKAQRLGFPKQVGCLGMAIRCSVLVPPVIPASRVIVWA